MGNAFRGLSCAGPGEPATDPLSGTLDSLPTLGSYAASAFGASASSAQRLRRVSVPPDFSGPVQSVHSPLHPSDFALCSACCLPTINKLGPAVANPGRIDYGRRFPVSVDLCPVDLFTQRLPSASLPVIRAGQPSGEQVSSTQERTAITLYPSSHGAHSLTLYQARRLDFVGPFSLFFSDHSYFFFLAGYRNRQMDLRVTDDYSPQHWRPFLSQQSHSDSVTQTTVLPEFA